MFNNSSHIDANHSTFSEVHRDQYFTSRTNVQGNQTVNTIVYGNQILQNSQIGLEALHKASAPSAAFDSAERHPAPRCLEGTRLRLLDRLTKWADSEDEDVGHKPVCWVNGRPGSGKSAVSQTIAETFASQKRLAATFFFSRRDIQRRTTHHFFPTITTQFLFSVPSIRPAILAALEQDPMLPSKVLREQMQKLLLEPLSIDIEHPPSSFLIIVDALDECDDPEIVVELVSLLIQFVRASPFPLRLLITSRPENWLQACFRQQDVASSTVIVEVESFPVEDDIRNFLQHSLNQVHQEHSQIMPDAPWPSTEDLDRIVEKASGLFIFAWTVVKFIGDRLHNPVQRLQAILDDKPSEETTYADLDALYFDAVSAFPDVDIIRLILGIVYCLSVPMTVSALHQLLDRQDVDVRIVIPALGSVLLSSENGEQPVQFYHASFRDFLVSPQRSRKYAIDVVICHQLMAELCFKIMVKSLKRNMCNIDNQFKLNHDIVDLQTRREVVYGEALIYASRYWLHHLTQLPSRGGGYESLLDIMQEFCRKVLLYWIEMSSIFDDVEKAILMLCRASNWLKSLAIVPKETLALIKDAERLLLLFRQPISQSAPHVYHTAIAFTPLSSPLYTNFKHEAGGSYVIHQGQDEAWQAYQYAISLRSIISVAFSPNGIIIATAGANQGVQLWNAATGGNVASLGDSASSVLVRFSDSGSFLAAAFEDGMVTVWDPNVGREHFKDVDVHTDKITCLGFSPDSSLLASGARDRTIQLWSLDSACRLRKLIAHEGPVTALAFIPDSQRLCSGAEDNLVILWDAKTGKTTRKMRSHRAGITTLDVSRDGTMVASGSQDKTIKIWDVRSGDCTRTLSKGHEGDIRAVHFFDDDTRFLSASNGTILASGVSVRKWCPDVTIWSHVQDLRTAASNAPNWALKAVGRGVPAFLWKKAVKKTLTNVESTPEILVARSLRSSSFAFSYLTETWCAPLGTVVEIPSLHVSRADLSTIALSPDGTRVAAGDGSGSLDILDTTVPSRKWTDESRDFSVPLLEPDTVVASPDGMRFLVHGGLTWYLVDSHFHLLCKVNFGLVDFMRTDDVAKPVFSADSRTFAWTMSDILDRKKNIVRVYESTTATQTVRFSGIKKVQVFVVSPDGNFVGCGHDGAITVCDVGMHVKRDMNVAPGTSVVALVFSSDSKMLLSGSTQGVIHLWDPSSGACKATVTHEAFNSAVAAVLFAPSTDLAVIAHTDGAVRIVSLLTSASYTLCPSENSFTQNMKDIYFSQDPLMLTCRTYDNNVSFWSMPSHLFPPGEGENYSLSCPVRDNPKQEECDGPPSEDGDVLASTPHLISEHKYQIFDCLFRSSYVIREDGWVCKGHKRLFWLPQHLRPTQTQLDFAAFNGTMMIRTHTGRALFLTLRDDL